MKSWRVAGCLSSVHRSVSNAARHFTSSAAREWRGGRTPHLVRVLALVVAASAPLASRDASAQNEPGPGLPPAPTPEPVNPQPPPSTDPSDLPPGVPPPSDSAPGAYGFDPHPQIRTRGKREGVTWEANADFRVSYIDRFPELKISQDVVGPRALSSGTVVHGSSSLVTGGLGFDFGIVLDDRWRLGGIGGSYESSMGTSARRRAYVDGNVAELRPWTASRFGFDFGGVGQRYKYRRWQFGWMVTGSVIVTTMNVSVASGAGSEDAWGAAVALSIHGQAEACRRLDLESRVCVAVAPDVFDGGYFMRGGSLLARWEWGR